MCQHHACYVLSNDGEIITKPFNYLCKQYNIKSIIHLRNVKNHLNLPLKPMYEILTVGYTGSNKCQIWTRPDFNFFFCSPLSSSFPSIYTSTINHSILYSKYIKANHLEPLSTYRFIYFLNWKIFLFNSFH